MSDYKMITTSGKETVLPQSVVEGFKGSLRGELLAPDSPGYDTARTIWNAMIDRRPGLIVRCSGTADVMQAVAFGRAHDLLVAVRGAGHNIAGNAVCNGGLVIDLSLMKSVQINPQTKRATVGPGATLRDFDHEAQAFGLATPTGINSTTGISGLTLGGGFGWLTRKHGMTVDNLISANVVTAEAKMVRASAQENADLFWGIRGGGGNFGIVTSFEFQLHPVGPEIFAGLIVFPFEEAKSVLTQYREFTETIPEEMNVWAVLRKAPPLPFLPENVHGKEVVVLAGFYAGAVTRGQELIQPVRNFAKPYGEFTGAMPYTGWQQAFDPLLTPGARNYWKSHNFVQLSDGAIDTVITYVGKLPSPHCEIFIGLLGGQASLVAPNATAYSQRDAKFVMNVHSRWETAAEDKRCIAWAREFFAAAEPYATGGVYVNFMTEDEADRIKGAYKPDVLSRLMQVKKTWDPGNFFRMNQNIKPSA
ncbi:MAG TPA: FAD-binding oxidoreductase [Saprospiraceae bacterium]|nr:FAD-binding oxidoreductase [Saprospiraceae bacterium]